MLPSLVILTALALVALTLTSIRRISEDGVRRRNAAVGLALATIVQVLHLAEESVTGLYVRLPALFSQEAMPFSIFLTFNIAWLAIWAVSIPGVRSGRSGAFFAAWFLAVASLFNGIAHPALALVSRGYFPGLVTSPIAGVAGAYLFFRLHSATRLKVS